MPDRQRGEGVVTTATRLIWVSVILPAVPTAASLFRDISTSVKAVNAGVFLALLIVFGFLATRLSLGRRWARVAFLILFLFFVPGMLAQIRYGLEFGMDSRWVLDTSVEAIGLILQLVALVLVFGPGRARFAAA
jgi:hypothetical protein